MDRARRARAVVARCQKAIGFYAPFARLAPALPPKNSGTIILHGFYVPRARFSMKHLSAPRDLGETMETLSPDAVLTRKSVAAALTECGYPTAETTLATLASRGGSPPYRKYGQRVLYRWGDVLAWAEARLSNPITSTSQLKQASASMSARMPATAVRAT
jgi:hypothetical protein